MSAQDSSGKTTGKFDTFTAISGTTYSRLIAFLPTDATKYGVVNAVIDKNGVPSSYAVTPTDTTSSSSKQIATVGWVNSTGNNVVHLNGSETITGEKAFTKTVVLNSELHPCSTTSYNSTNPPASNMAVGTIRWSVNATSGSTSYLGGGKEFARIQPILFTNGDQALYFSVYNQQNPQKGRAILGITHSADGNTYYATLDAIIGATDNSSKIPTTAWCTTASKEGNLIGAPNYSAAVDITISVQTSYTATENGFILLGGIAANNSEVYVDGVTVGYITNSSIATSFIIPISKGSVCSVASGASISWSKFVPCK